MTSPVNGRSEPHDALSAWEDFVAGQVYPAPRVKAKEDYRTAITTIRLERRFESFIVRTIESTRTTLCNRSARRFCH
jgi:hypothetical protein